VGSEFNEINFITNITLDKNFPDYGIQLIIHVQITLRYVQLDEIALGSKTCHHVE